MGWRITLWRIALSYLALQLKSDETERCPSISYNQIKGSTLLIDLCSLAYCIAMTKYCSDIFTAEIKEATCNLHFKIRCAGFVMNTIHIYIR